MNKAEFVLSPIVVFLLLSYSWSKFLVRKGDKITRRLWSLNRIEYLYCGMPLVQQKILNTESGGETQAWLSLFVKRAGFMKLGTAHTQSWYTAAICFSSVVPVFKTLRCFPRCWWLTAAPSPVDALTETLLPNPVTEGWRSSWWPCWSAPPVLPGALPEHLPMPGTLGGCSWMPTEGCCSVLPAH